MSTAIPIPDDLYHRMPVIEAMVFQDPIAHIPQHGSEGEESQESTDDNAERTLRWNLVGAQGAGSSQVSIFSANLSSQLFPVVYKTSFVTIAGMSAPKLVELLINVDLRSQWDLGLIKAQVLQENTKTKVVSFQYRTQSSVFCVREFVLLLFAYKIKGDRWVVLQHSVGRPLGSTSSQGGLSSFLIAHGTMSSAFGIVPIDSSSVKISFLAQINLGGFLQWAPNLWYHPILLSRLEAVAGLKSFIESGLGVTPYFAIADISQFASQKARLESHNKTEQEGESGTLLEPLQGEAMQIQYQKVPRVQKRIVSVQWTESMRRNALNFMLLVRHKESNSPFGTSVMPLPIFQQILSHALLLRPLYEWSHPKDLPLEYAKLLDQACETLLKYSQEQWEFVLKESEVTVSKKTSPTGNIVKGETVIKASPEAIVGLSSQIERKKEYDSLFDFGKEIKRWDAHTVMYRFAYKAVWPTTARDFCLLTQTRFFTDMIIDIAVSINTPECPPATGYVRAELIVGGNVCTPNKTQNACKMCYITHTDLKGNLPQSVINIATKKDPLALANMAGVLAREKDCKYPPLPNQKQVVKKEIEEIVFDTVAISVPRAKEGSRKKKKLVSTTVTKTVQRVFSERQRRQTLRFLLAVWARVDTFPLSKLPPNIFKHILQMAAMLSPIPYKWAHPQGLPPKYAKLLDEACEKLIQCTKEEWEPVCEKEGVVVTKKVLNSSQKAKGVTTFACPPRAILGLTKDLSRKPEFDSLFSHGREVRRWGNDTLILHLSYKPIFPTSGRDFVILAQTRYYPDRIIELAASVETDLVPPQPNYVRAEVITGGNIYVPDKTGKSTNVTYIAQIDLKGNLPTWIVNMVAQKDPLSLINLRALAEKEDPSKHPPLPTESSNDDTKMVVPVQISEVIQMEVDDEEGDDEAQSQGVEFNLDDDRNNLPTKVNNNDRDLNNNNYDVNNNNNNNLTNDNNVNLRVSENMLASPLLASESDTPLSSRNNSGILNNSASDSPRKRISFAKLYPELATSSCSQTETKWDSIIQATEMSVKQAVQDADKNGWEIVKKKNDVLICRKVNPDSQFHSFKGIGEIKAPAHKIKDKLWALDSTGEYDPLFKKGTIVESIDQYKRVLQLEFQAKRCLMTTSRDFCLISSWREEKGVFVITGKSIAHAKCPPRLDKGVTRGEIRESGFVIMPRTPDTSLVFYITQVDLGGISPTIVNLIAESQPLVIAGIRKVMESKK